jgi:hypothetical protein
VWDLSPGFSPILLTGRAILPDCLFCHANRASHVPGTVNRYTEPIFDGYTIGCQRCHGPGALHAASQVQSDGVDYTIVNPRHLKPSLREAVCEQCHLTGKERIVRRGREMYDFRPGLPLELFFSVFVRAPDGREDSKAVGHVEQMYQSRCFQASKGELGCVSCHDPHEHEPAAQRVAHYRARCFQCHQDDTQNPAPEKQKIRKVMTASACSFPIRERSIKGDSCIDCHMPRYGSSDIPHAASTDHRIPRGGKQTAAKETPPASQDTLPIVSFYRTGNGIPLEEDERDRALALVEMARSGDGAAFRVLAQSVPVLDAALQRDSEDFAAAEARGYALALQNRWAEALPAFQAILAKVPNQEMTLVGAASSAEELKQVDAAVSYWQRAISVNPWEPGYHRHLALLLVKKEAWNEAIPACEAWLRLDPFSAEARWGRVQGLLATGKKEEARAEFARIVALAPLNLRELEIRFKRKTQ